MVEGWAADLGGDWAVEDLVAASAVGWAVACMAGVMTKLMNILSQPCNSHTKQLAVRRQMDMQVMEWLTVVERAEVMVVDLAEMVDCRMGFQWLE